MEKYTKLLQTLPNGRKIFKMVIQYANIFHSKALQNIPKSDFFGTKINHLATLLVARFFLLCIGIMVRAGLSPALVTDAK
jgi:hypothetical protein